MRIDRTGHGAAGLLRNSANGPGRGLIIGLLLMTFPPAWSWSADEPTDTLSSDVRGERQIPAPPPFTSVSPVPDNQPAAEAGNINAGAIGEGAPVEPEKAVAGTDRKKDPLSPCKELPRDRDDWLERVRSGIEYSICASSYRVDSFFGNRDEEEIIEAEEVYGRLRVGTYWDDEKGFDPEFRLMATYPLPRLQKRARAVVGRGTDEELIEGAPREVTQAQALSGDDEDVNWLVGLGVDRIRSRNSRLSFGAGIKLQNPINPYAKATYRYYKPVSDEFMLRFQQVVYWENINGFGTTTRADAEWLLREGRVLRWGNYFKIHENTDGVAWNTNLSIYQRLGDGQAVALRGLVRGETGSDVQPTKYQLVAIYRQRFLRDWLFVELYGGTSWIRRELEDPRKPVPELGLIFEIVFGDHPMLAD